MFDQIPLEILIKPNININCLSDKTKQEFVKNDFRLFQNKLSKKIVKAQFLDFLRDE